MMTSDATSLAQHFVVYKVYQNRVNHICMMFQSEQGYSFLTYRTKHIFLSMVHIQFYILSYLGPVGVHIVSGSDFGGTNQSSPCDGGLECCTIKQHAKKEDVLQRYFIHLAQPSGKCFRTKL